MKKILVLIGISILPFTIVTAEEVEMEIHIEYWPFEDIEDMRSVSSDIVQLEILDERAEWVNIWENHDGVIPSERDLYDVYTIHRARVLNVFQGDLAIGEIIEVRQIGGSLDGIILLNPSMVNFSYSDNVVLFLGEAVTSHFVIMLPYQAAYIISGNGDLIGYHQNPAFNDLGLTWDILEQIQYENGIESISNTTENTESNVAEGSDVENNVTGSNDVENNDTENIEVENSVVENNGIGRSGVAIGIVIVGSTLAILFLVLIMRGRNRKRDNS